jgi:hypothetical protein
LRRPEASRSDEHELETDEHNNEQADPSFPAVVDLLSDQVTTWTKTIDKINDALSRWEKGNPTIEGRRLIIIMVVGGMTQYLAKVQGMPAEIERKLERRIRNFLWNDKKTIPINKEIVYAPIEMGGHNLLDIIARNEAITATWLRSYLDFGPKRPLWAFAADEYIALNLLSDDEKIIDKNVRTSVFLQAWDSKQTLKLMDLCNQNAEICETKRSQDGWPRVFQRSHERSGHLVPHQINSGPRTVQPRGGDLMPKSKTHDKNCRRHRDIGEEIFLPASQEQTELCVSCLCRNKNRMPPVF